MKRASPGSTQRWLREVAINWESEDCLLYPFSVGSHGYGQANVDGLDILAHRFICETWHGPAPAGYEAAHSCGTRRCVNKRHLRWATHSENVGEMVKHNRSTRGEKHSMVKLTRKQVIKIRAARGTQDSIAARFGVSQASVSNIKLGRQWGWL